MRIFINQRRRKQKKEDITQVPPDGGNHNELGIIQVPHLVLVIFRLLKEYNLSGEETLVFSRHPQ